MKVTWTALALGTLAAAGCSPVDDLRYRNQGAGVALYTETTAANTANLTSYFGELCEQAGYGTTNCAPAPGQAAPAAWSLLVETGYNDIDFRCDSYLNWIEEKRSQRIMVDGTSNALGNLVTGVLAIAGVGAAEIVYTALSLGFAKSVYDSHHNSILLGLEGSTIKEMVNQRRAEHREQFRTRTYQNRAQAVYALRTYLTYCTPQAILTDVNTLSRRAARGDADGVRKDAERAAKLVAAPTSDSSAGVTGKRNVKVLDLSAKVAKVFEGRGFGAADVRTLQGGSCIRADGDPGPATILAARIVEETLGSSRANMNGKLDRSEWAVAEPLLATAAPGCAKGLKNFYEAFTYGPPGSDDGGARAVSILVAQNKLDARLAGKDLSDGDVRKGLAKIRSDAGLTEKPAGVDFSDQITPKFDSFLFP